MASQTVLTLVPSFGGRRRSWRKRSSGTSSALTWRAPKPRHLASPSQLAPGCNFRRLAEALGILTSMEERELHFEAEQPLIGWRLFRVRRSESGFVLSAPFIHNPGGKS